MAVRERGRLDPSVFRLPVDRIREGYYSDAYFNYTKQVLERDDHHPRVVMQIFQRRRSLLGGIDEAIAVMKECAGRYDTDGRWIPGFDELDVRALHEADEISPWETVMTIEGDYSLFVHLETVYLGCLARRTLIMRNVREVVDAARGKPILFFPARHDHWLVQTGDGWSAHIAGAIGVSTDAQASWWGGRGVGTVPHGLIAAYGGDTALAARKFADQHAGDMNITVLVDFANDSVRTALEVADALGDDLWGVRLDTSDRIADVAMQQRYGEEAPRGVAAELVEVVREALDVRGYSRVKIVASGGFTAERIRAFEDADVPVDSYGVGSSLIRGANDFTADVVMVNGQPCAKVGRELKPNPRLRPVH
jgi:nicotinate phosphoribosyltransferase